MAIYTYEREVTFRSGDNLKITVKHVEVATASTHAINLPDTSNAIDFPFTNEGSVDIGNVNKLIGKTIKIYSKALNLNNNDETVELAYLVNDNEILRHKNLKSEDKSPRIKINLSIQTK